MSVSTASNGGVSEEERSEDEPLSTGDIYFTLSNCRRRFLIQYLSRQESMSVTELSRVIAAWENETTVEELSYDERKTVYTALLQTHLPKLDEMGVVEYDASRKHVRLTDRAEQLRPYLELDREGTDGDDAIPYGLLVWVLLGVAAFGVLLGRYSVAGLEGALLTALSFGVAAGVSVGFVLAATETVSE
jgi:hypothetical protein